MTDWPEAGRKSWRTRQANDARRVRDLYRATFSSPSKVIARGRVLEALRAAGVTTVIDLWGGGASAEELVTAGFRVIAVENGSMVLEDGGRPVSSARKKRALEYAATEGGYEWRWGAIETFASEADGAYLDFCGPWTAATRRAVTACRHMKAAAVTLTPDHDIASGAATSHERQMAYQLFLKMAWSDKPRWEFMQSGAGVRRLLDYRRPRGYAVFLYLLSRVGHIAIRAMTSQERMKTSPEFRERVLANKRAHYHRLSPDRKRAWGIRTHERAKAKYHSDPDYRARVMLKAKHRKHQVGIIPRVPCALCISTP